MCYSVFLFLLEENRNNHGVPKVGRKLNLRRLNLQMSDLPDLTDNEGSLTQATCSKLLSQVSRSVWASEDVVVHTSVSTCKNMSILGSSVV